MKIPGETGSWVRQIAPASCAITRNVSLGRFDQLVNRYTAEVVVAALSPYVGQLRRDAIERVLAARLSGVSLVVEDLFDPRNVAATMRTAEAFGVYRMHVIDPKLANGAKGEFRPARTVTKGCHRWMLTERWASAPACIAALRDAGVEVWAAALDGAQQLADIDATRPVALLFGSEHNGVSSEARAACTGAFAIPMHGFSQSLNIGAAAAVALHSIVQRRRSAIGAMTDLTPAQTQRMRANMLAWSSRQPEALVAHHVAAGNVRNSHGSKT